jgi:acetylornithine deacetylase/succinyl-diaminopimelate desuccinylase-like protein
VTTSLRYGPDGGPDGYLRRQAETVELLQTLIRNACVNDGTPESGHEQRNADVLQQFLALPGVELQRFDAAPGRASLVARLAGSDPQAPSLCLMGHTDVVPADPSGWSRDPFGAELITSPARGERPELTEVWGRGAVDMLNLTASMAVAFRHLASGGGRPAGDLIYFAVADEESGSAYGAQWMAEHHRDAIMADYVLTENGGLHSGPADSPWIGINVAEKGVAWRRLRITGRPGHGSMPFRADNALIRAAAVVQRLADYRPPPRLHELWRERVETLGVDEELQAALMDPNQIDEVLANLGNGGTAGHLHACTHTTFSPNTSGAPVMKTNVIPGVVELGVDIRTLPGESSEDVEDHLRTALGDLYDAVEVEILMNDPASISRTDTPLWDALHAAVQRPFPTARLSPHMVVGFTDARVYRRLGAVAYGAGLFSPALDGGEFSRRFHGDDERIDIESLGLTTQLWLDVVAGLTRTA